MLFGDRLEVLEIEATSGVLVLPSVLGDLQAREDSEDNHWELFVPKNPAEEPWTYNVCVLQKEAFDEIPVSKRSATMYGNESESSVTVLVGYSRPGCPKLVRVVPGVITHAELKSLRTRMPNTFQFRRSIDGHVAEGYSVDSFNDYM